MDHLVTRILARPGLEQAQLAGNAVRGEMGHDGRRAFAGLATWAGHENAWVRIASGVGYGVFATADRESLAQVLPHLERLARDPDETVRRHGAQSAFEQLWLTHADAMETIAETWARHPTDPVRELVARAVASIAVSGKIRRPSILRRFIERGLSILDGAVPDASPEMRRVLVEVVNEIATLAPDLASPMVREWARREDVGALRLAQEIALAPCGTLLADVDFAGAAQRLLVHQAKQRIRVATWVRQGHGGVEYPYVQAKELLAPQTAATLPWAHTADPYRGCQLRCEFCNARSLSEWSGEDRDGLVRRVTVVRNAADVLARELAEESRQPRERNVIGIGALADPYQPAEERAEVVRAMLKVCLDLGHPVVIQTRQSLVVRDLDLLEEMAEKGLVNVLIALQTAVEGFRSKIEVGTATLAERFRAIGMLARKEVPVGVVLSPVMPDLTDDAEILDETMRRASESGASWAVAETLNLHGSAGVKVRLFLEDSVKTLVPRYDELYGPDMELTPAGVAWREKLVEDVLPGLRKKHELDDVGRMLTSGRDPQALLVR